MPKPLPKPLPARPAHRPRPVGKALGKGAAAAGKGRDVTAAALSAPTTDMDTRLTRPHRRPCANSDSDAVGQYVAALVESAPPLTKQQTERLRLLLLPNAAAEPPDLRPVLGADLP